MTPTEPAIREMALREVKELVRKLHSGSSHPDAESWIANEIEALIPQPSALEDICKAVAYKTCKFLHIDETYFMDMETDLQSIVSEVIAEWEGKK